MTYGEAKANGWKEADTKYERGYVSRKVDVDQQPVLVAGGSRKGQLYVKLPCWSTTLFCVRQYLTK